MATYSVKPGVHHTYLELENNPADAPPTFVLQTGRGSAMSVSSHNNRPPLTSFSASGPVRSGPGSISRILSPSEPGAVSMQIPRSSGPGERPAVPCQRGASYQPPVRPYNGSSRRCSVPLKSRRESQQPLLPGKSMPLIAANAVSPPPISSPSTPHLLDPPLPYLTPERPWYKTDPDSPNAPVSGH